MNSKLLALVALLSVLATGLPASGRVAPEGTIAPKDLRCEYLVNPLGIDAKIPRLSWTLDATKPELRGRMQTAYQILVASSAEGLTGDKGDLWDSGKVKSDQTAQVAFAGAALPARSRAFWKVRAWDNDDKPSAWSKTASWSMGLLAPADWGGAEWIGDPTPLLDPDPLAALPAAMLRKPFVPGKDADRVKRATLYVTSLGMYELRIDSNRVGERILAPEWTDYNKRVQYQTYDVTRMLRTGEENVLTAALADGWYAGRIGLSFIVKDGPPRAIYGRKPRLRLRLDIEYAAGGTQTVISDGSWQCSTEGPIRSADILDGTIYDATRELAMWDMPGFAPEPAQHWSAAKVYGPIDAALVAQPNEPILITRTLTPIAVTEPKPGTFVFDLGQNMVGHCMLNIGGEEPGTEVTMRHAEVLNPDGTIFTENLRSAKATDRYVVQGSGLETFSPPFTYHGFRYVEVTGLKHKPSLDQITGCVANSAPAEVGSFECSDPMLTKLMQNIVWTQRGNMQSVPTDCPQRDERLGWMGDILAFTQSACFNMDMAAFYTKWLADVRDAQADDGRFGDFSPHPYDPNVRFSGTPAWGDAGVVVPWNAYLNYGDKRILADQFDAAKRWVDYIHDKNPDLLWKNSRGNDYGDWLTTDTFKIEGYPKSGADTPHDVFGTIFFYHSADLLAKMAGVLGRDQDAKTYANLAADIRAAFNKAYVKPDGTIEGNTQGSYALALQFGLNDADQRATAARHMVDGFAPYKGSLSTGFHSTGPLMQQLVENGYLSDAYRLLTSRTMPGWLYPIEHGATTTWERWDGYTEGRGFQDSGMNSFSHYAFGAVGEWMYRNVIGLNPDAPGWQQFTIRPRPGGGLTWAKGSYDSIRGKIACDWKIDAGRITMSIQVPANTAATVFVPSADSAAVTEGGKPAAKSPGVEFLRAEPGTAVFKVGSGKYTFSAPAPAGP